MELFQKYEFLTKFRFLRSKEYKFMFSTYYDKRIDLKFYIFYSFNENMTAIDVPLTVR